MDKLIERNLLYDFYGQLLTDHQKRIYEDAAYGDLSLSELADAYEISRQGIHDLLKRCDRQLLEYEEKLQLIDRFLKLRGLIGQIRTLSGSGDEKDARITALTDEMMELL